MQIGIITVEIKGLDSKKIERYRDIIHTLIVSNSLDVKNGQTIINWGPNGELMNIDITMKMWKRRKHLT